MSIARKCGLAALVVLGLVATGADADYLADTVMVPAVLAAKAGAAGFDLAARHLVLVERGGLIDRNPDVLPLRMNRSALASLSTPEQRTVVMAFALSYKAGFRKDPKSSGRRALDALSTVAAADMDEGVSSRERRDPYLKLPTSIRAWDPQQEGNRGDRTAVALRALAWANSAGICPGKSVAILEAILAGGAGADAANDARGVLRDLGMARFSSDERCR